MTVPDIANQIGVVQLLIPPVCSGILGAGIILFLYMFHRSHSRLNLSMAVLSVTGFVFVASESMVLATGSWYKMFEVAVQFHRLEHLASTSFLFAIPFFFRYLLKLNKGLHRFNYYFGWFGLGFSVMILLIAFIWPDLFISTTVRKADWQQSIMDIGRGQEGAFYGLRDLLLFWLMGYGLFVLIYDVVVNRRFSQLAFPLAGISMVIVAGIIDVLHVHTGKYYDFFYGVPFSRFSLGVTIFLSLCMMTVARKFIKQAMEAEHAYHEMNQAFNSLNRSEERFRQLADNINEIVILSDYPVTRVSYANQAYEKIWQRPVSELYDDPHSWIFHVHAEDREFVSRVLYDQHIHRLAEIEYRLQIDDSRVLWVRDRVFPIHDGEGKVYRLARIIEDVTARKLAESELKYIAYHDSLTVLYNRKAFIERFEDSLLQARRQHEESLKALLFIDLDRFKDVNDSLGHNIGDELLRLGGQRIRDVLRKSDYVFRIGGDEFTIILNSISQDLDAAAVALKIIDSLARPFFINEEEIYIGVSVGIAIYPRDGNDPETLFKNADAALYEAKKTRNAYSFFDADMNIRAVDRMRLDKYIRVAVENNDFRLYYQPFVNLAGEVCGMESLIRWNHVSMGNVPPDRFIPVAEANGFILAIGDWVLTTACANLVAWQTSGFGNLKVAVNLSPRQFRQQNFVEKVREILEQTGLNPESLELEITEGSVMEDPEDAIRKMKSLRDIGIDFSIDDFGTGYSSLSYIRRFPISRLKIDKSFIVDLEKDDNNMQLTRAIISMAHNLNLQVIAEGVESGAQRDLLASWDCDVFQGYHFSRPLPADEFHQYLLLNRN